MKNDGFYVEVVSRCAVGAISASCPDLDEKEIRSYLLKSINLYNLSQ